MPSTLPLSVTGSCAGAPPADCGRARPLHALGLACLGAWLSLAGPARAALDSAPAKPIVGSPPSLLAGNGTAAGVEPSAMPAAQPASPAGGPAAQPPGPASSPAAATPIAVPGILPPGAAATTAPPPPLSQEEFQTLLRSADLDRLALLCNQLIDAGDNARLQVVRERLLTIHPAPQPLPVVLANADVLLSCRMPDGALTVLDRIGPARGAEQVQWLILQWRAANAALDHRRAALALERLSAERPAALEALLLPLQQRLDGTWVSRSALEVLASHLSSAGLKGPAASLLLLSSRQDGAAAERLAEATRLLADLPEELREPVFERALEQAAATGSWGLVGELLAAQAALPANPENAARTAERRLRLSRRLDDAYGEWRALRDAADPTSLERRRQLQQQLRSPRNPGGHAEALPAPAPLTRPRPAGTSGSDAPSASTPAAGSDGTDPAAAAPANPGEPLESDTTPSPGRQP